MIAPPTSAWRATRDGLFLTIRAPGLLLAILLVTMTSAIPFAFAIEPALMESLALQPPAAAGSSEIDPEWWIEFRRQATGLAATFTPAILGFAAPLDNLSALLDGTPRPAALAWPVLLSAVVWAFLWGGVLHRFATGDSSARGFLSAATRCFGRLIAITMIAAAANLLIYLSVHAVLLGTLYDAIAASVSTERDAFLARVALYAVFAAVLALLNAVFSFARIAIVAHGETNIVRALTHAWLFVRACFTSVTSLYVIFAAVFVLAMIAYGALELAGGSRVGGWRAVAIGQAFIAFRLALRLGLGASQVRLAAASYPPSVSRE
jgi:hypothetical protein